MEITVASPNGGNSGTSTYLWQGGYNQLSPTNTWYKLLPLQQGRGHGSGLSGTSVYIRQSTPYQYDIAVAATASTKNLDITILDKNPANNTKFTDLSENAAQAIPANAKEVFSSHSFYAGKVGVGTAVPTEELHVEGNLRMVDGNEGAGKFLMSDANGVASWQEFNPLQEVKQNKFETRVNAGQLQELGRYLTTEGTAILEITVASPNGGNSGTSTYLWQGGYNQLSPTNTWYKLVPLQQGRGHGSGLSGTSVYIRQSTPYQYDIAVAATASTKNLDVTILDKNPANNTKFTDLSENASQAIPANTKEVFSSHSFYAGKVGIGTSTPSTLLDVKTKSNQTANFEADGSTNFVKFRNNYAANNFGQTQMLFQNQGTNGSDFIARIMAQNNGNLTDARLRLTSKYNNGAKSADLSIQSGALTFWNDDHDFGTPILKAQSNGRVGLGTNTPKAKLDVAGGMVFSTDGAKVTGESGFYVSGGELFAFDATGNSTTISPHNFSLIKEGASEEMAWSFFSQKGTKAINVDMAKLARIVEQLSGETLVHISEEGEITTQEVENSLTDKVEALEAENEELKARLARLEALLLGETKSEEE